MITATLQTSCKYDVQHNNANIYGYATSSMVQALEITPFSKSPFRRARTEAVLQYAL